MKDTFDIAKARQTVEQLLRRRDIGNTHQRAMLVGMLASLEWVAELGTKANNVLQQLIDGRAVLANGETVAEAHARQKVEDAQKSKKLVMSIPQGE